MLPSRLAPLAILLPLLPVLSGAAAAQLPGGSAGRDVEHAMEEIGSWLLSCTADPMTDRRTCRLMLRQPAVPATLGQSALTLEVLRRGDRAVPAVTARDLTLEGIGRGLLAFTGTAQLRFPPNKLFEMPCALEGRSVVCAPHDEDSPRAAAELAAADRALVRIVGLVPGESDGVAPTELRLRDTGEAVARWRARSPQDEAGAGAGFDLRNLLGRLLRFLNG
ncbi:hypothetical protein [Roseomonas elaeocarpi]|uniref:Invasion associated locus B family protein n=1 Tax=Roseomonas elaeocarpi TaxID=907779 RepID=A0ABV6JNP6_9PROT